MLLPLCATALALAATPTDVTAAPSSSAHVSPFAVHVSLTSVPLSSSAGIIGLGVLGGVGDSATEPHVSLSAELRFASHWTFLLGANVGFASGAVFPASQLSFGGSAAVRWYARAAFDGPFVGLEAPVAWAQVRSSYVDADGVTQTSLFSSTSYGAAVLAGWVFAWDNGLLVSCAAGPSATLRRVAFGGTSDLAAGAIGLKLQLGVGLRF